MGAKMTARGKSLIRPRLFLLAMLANGACTSGPAPSHPPYQQRIETRHVNDVTIRAVVLTNEESAATYGAPLSELSIQPVWIEVQNTSDAPHWLLYPGLDPNFFPASEAAEAMATARHGALEVLDRRFRGLAFANPIPAGTTKSGYVLTNTREGAKLLQIDVFSDRHADTASILAFVPGLRADYEHKERLRARLLAAESPVDVTDYDQLRTALEALPCCVTGKDGTKNGDPLNLVVIGDVGDAFPALIRRGWTATETTWSGSVMHMAKSAMNRDRYPYAPVSNLYLYGRPQDLALQKARDTVHQRNHMRLWRSPMRFQGKPVWVGQISRDIGSRMTIHSPTLTTHKIDPDVDEAAYALFEDLAYSQTLKAWGLVAGVGAVPKDAPRENLTTDPYYTHGLRFVFIFDREPTSLADIQFLPWEPAVAAHDPTGGGGFP